MSDSEVEKLKTEIDDIMIRINTIIKKIEDNEPGNGCNSKKKNNDEVPYHRFCSRSTTELFD